MGFSFGFWELVFLIFSQWFSLDVHEIFMGFSLDLIGSDWGNLMYPIGIPLNPIGFH